MRGRALPTSARYLAFVAFAVALFLYLGGASGASRSSQASDRGDPTVDGVKCGFFSVSRTHREYHVHAHLAVFVKGTSVVATTADTGHFYTGACLYWVHAHDTSGIIHIEAPRKILPTLGAWVRIERITMPQLHESYPSLYRRAGEQRRVWLDMRPYHGDPLKIVLRYHTQVVVEFGPPWVSPPKFTFPSWE